MKRYLLPKRTRRDLALLRAVTGFECTEEDIIAYAVELLKDRCREGIIRAQELNAV